MRKYRQNFTSGLGLSHSVRSIRSVSLKFYLILILAGALMLSSLPLSVQAEEMPATDDTVKANTENDGDLSTTKFDTLEGTVVVNLPGDTAAGDEISGTVVEEPKGKTPEEKAANQDTLEGYVVEVANKPAKDDDSGQWSIPLKAESVHVVLKKKTGEVLGQTEVPVVHQHHTSIDDRSYQVPPVGQAGKPVRIDGKFNGNFTTTAVKIGGTGAAPIAESPRSSIVKIPTGATGPTTIDVVKDGKQVASCPFTVLDIKLAATKLNLQRGETSELSVNVTGVRGMKTPATVKLENKFPETMRMGGGDSQMLTVPANMETDTFTKTTSLTGVKIGNFAITAVVKSPPCAAAGCATCNPDAKATGPTPRLDTTPPSTNSRTAAIPSSGPPTPSPTPQQTEIIKSKSNITNNRTAAPTPDTKPGERRVPLPNTFAAKNGRIQGLTVQITGADGSIIATQVTDKDGNVDFGVLPEGEYVLTIIAGRFPGRRGHRIDSGAGESPDASTPQWGAGKYEWIKASLDGKAEKIKLKPDSTGGYGGAQFSASGMTTFRADGKGKVKWFFSDD